MNDRTIRGDVVRSSRRKILLGLYSDREWNIAVSRLICRVACDENWTVDQVLEILEGDPDTRGGARGRETPPL